MTTAKTDVNYSSLANEGNPFIEHHHIEESTLDIDNEDTPRNSGIMIHVVPETSKTRWNHIEDLDSFFTRMYSYHQKHGFSVIAVEEALQILQFAFVVWLITSVFHCIKYSIIFGDDPKWIIKLVTIPDVVVSAGECVASFGLFTWICLVMSGLLLLFKFIKYFYHIVQYWDIKKFFNTALKIEDYELDNLTWHEVQKKVREVQSEQQMCIHKAQLSELDIYHRILRFKNYMVAMMNKNLLPARMKVPLLGEVDCLSRGLRFNIELILFRGPWSPFENNWHLREEFKRNNKRLELAHKLSRQILWVAIANLVLSPFVFLWQLAYISFSYAAILKKEPGALGMRCWSQYGRLYLRHFNELDHELDARLNRAYEPADKYVSSFSSPLMAVIAKSVLFVCGGILAVILLLTVYNERVMQIEHVLTIASILTAIAIASRGLIPNENLIWCPEQLLTTVLAHVHYLPVTWRNVAHTTRVRQEFEHFFQFKAIHLLTELFSPFVTPFVLMYQLRPRALDIVDFFRNFTVSVVGVGDVCSFAQMDVRKHGNPDWQLTQSAEESVATNENPKDYACETNQYTQGEHGKTELSLIHFTLTNPEWKMPAQAKHFMQGIRRHAIQDLNRARQPTGIAGNNTAMGNSLISFGSMGNEYSSIAQSVLQTHSFINGFMPQSTYQQPRNVVPPTNQNAPPAPTTYPHSYDFDHMLHQNLYDGSSMPMRSGFLQNIQEGDAEEDELREREDINAPPPEMSESITRSMEKSVRRGMTKREGRLEGPNEGLLYSLYGLYQPLTTDPFEITTADMCLSTLYLHELHYRQMQRRGVRLEQSQRQVWQRPHQQQQHQPQTSSASGIVTMRAAESTPLLGQRRS